MEQLEQIKRIAEKSEQRITDLQSILTELNSHIKKIEDLFTQIQETNEEDSSKDNN